VTEGEQFADAGSLQPVVRAVFRGHRDVAEVERLPGGSKKGAYRVTVDDGGTVLVYVWNAAEDYWRGVLPEGADDPADAFSHASGLGLFEAAYQRLTSAGVRCPRLLLSDHGRELYPGDIAVVEYVPGMSLEELLERDPAAASRPLAKVADWLASMEACRAKAFGKVAVVDAGQRSHGTSCEQAVLQRALRQVTEICICDVRARPERARLEELLHSLAETLKPRTSFGLVHGELGPDHILLDCDGDPVMIDIEGLKYFDPEWEHAFVRLRFGEHYSRLGKATLDPDRLRFYQLAWHLDLVAGPLRVAESGHPERHWFLELAEYHLAQALAFQ
jgi:hypothetical protein